MPQDNIVFPRTLTIVGNGFDLSLDALTSYECFYNCLKDCFETDDIDVFKNKYINNDNTDCLKAFFELVKEKNDNYFINYFLRYKKIFGDWVSFETELTRIVRSFDSLITHLNNRNDYIIGISTDAGVYMRILSEVDLMSTINVFPNNRFFECGTKAAMWMKVDPPVVLFKIKEKNCKNEYEVYKSIDDFTLSFPKGLYDDLCVFSDLFSLYLLIVKDIKNDKISYGAMLDSDYFINYNYTNYLDYMTAKNGCCPLDILYINGRIDYSTYKAKNRVVFGIDSNTKLKNIGFEVFTKTVQRSLYDTDIQRLSRILSEDIEVIYIFGHSMNLADFESLNYIFSCSEKYGMPSVYIYCLNDSAKIDIIMNLRRILGNDRFDDYQRKGRLNFPYCKEMIINKKKEQEDKQ